MSGDDVRVNDAIQSLARISQASARLMADLHLGGRLVDHEEELPHIRANLDHVERLMSEASR